MHQPTTNGESFPMMYARVAGFLDELKQKPYRRVAIFAHGGVLMCAGIYGKLFSEKDCFKHLAPYGGIEKITLISGNQVFYDKNKILYKMEALLCQREELHPKKQWRYTKEK